MESYSAQKESQEPKRRRRRAVELEKSYLVFLCINR